MPRAAEISSSSPRGNWNQRQFQEPVHQWLSGSAWQGLHLSHACAPHTRRSWGPGLCRPAVCWSIFSSKVPALQRACPDQGTAVVTKCTYPKYRATTAPRSSETGDSCSLLPTWGVGRGCHSLPLATSPQEGGVPQLGLEPTIWASQAFPAGVYNVGSGLARQHSPYPTAEQGLGQYGAT